MIEMSDRLPQRIEALRSAVYPSFALLAGMQLDLFTALAAAPLTAQQLAAATVTDAPRLRVLLYALVNAGLLTVEDECFANTAEAEVFLVRGREGSMLERHHLWSELWRALGHTADSIRDGRPHAPQGLCRHAGFGVALIFQRSASQRHGRRAGVRRAV